MVNIADFMCLCVFRWWRWCGMMGGCGENARRRSPFTGFAQSSSHRLFYSPAFAVFIAPKHRKMLCAHNIIYICYTNTITTIIIAIAHSKHISRVYLCIGSSAPRAPAVFLCSINWFSLDWIGIESTDTRLACWWARFGRHARWVCESLFAHTSLVAQSAGIYLHLCVCERYLRIWCTLPQF